MTDDKFVGIFVDVRDDDGNVDGFFNCKTDGTATYTCLLCGIIAEKVDIVHSASTRPIDMKVRHKHQCKTFKIDQITMVEYVT